MGYAWEGDQPCGCSLMERCQKHGDMMETIYNRTWGAPMPWAPDVEPRFQRVWALSDGYGEPGEVPVQGYDWSGIRDSSVEAVEAMYAEAIR